MKRKMLCLFLVLCLTGSMVACTSSATPEAPAPEAPAPAAEPEAPADAPEAPAAEAPAAEAPAEETPAAPADSTGLPFVTEPTTLSYWVPIDRTKAAPVLTNYSEVAAYQELERITGVTIEFVHPAMGQETEQFNIMMASREFPDIIFYGWGGTFPGGPQKAMDDEIILPLNDLLEYTPNFKERVVDVPEIAKTLATDNGDYTYFPYVHWNQLVVAGWSYLVRNDWLTDLGLELPTTIAEWDVMLKAFKDMGDMNGNGVADEYPILNCQGAPNRDMIRWLANAWGTDMEFYHNNNQVQFGPMDDAFLEYLTKMNEWYSAGYIDPEFSLADLAAYEAKVANGQGAVFLSGLDFGRYIIQMGDNSITGLQYPTLEEGVKPIYNNGSLQGSQNSGNAITFTCENPELAAKWLDYHYSDEGHMLLNFGIEGQSYNMVDGTPVFTDEIIANPEGLSVELALVKYAMGGIAEGFFHDPLVRYARFGTFPEQRETIDRTQDIDLTHKIPAITQTSEESTELANITNELNTYVLENWAAFINGDKPLSEFDSFRDTLRSMGVDRAIEIKQAGLDRFNQR